MNAALVGVREEPVRGHTEAEEIVRGEAKGRQGGGGAMLVVVGGYYRWRDSRDWTLLVIIER